MRLITFLVILLAICAARAEEDALDYFYSPKVGLEQQLLVNRVLIHARNTELDNAISVSDELLERTRQLRDADPVVDGQLLVNHGILLTATRDYEQALTVIDEGLALLEQELRPFSKELINAIMAKGLTEMAMHQLDEAEDSFRRAQHITHREGGVYAADQMVMLNYLAATSLQRGDGELADIQQLLSLRVAEETHGPTSPAMLPVLSRLGSYFASRGSTIPAMVVSETANPELRLLRDSLFRHAINMYDRALGIVSQEYGEKDMRMVPYLRGLASARLMQVTARSEAEKVLLKSLDIVESQPDINVVNLAQAHVDLGDLYIIISDDRAGEQYLSAWRLLQDSVELREVAHALFDVPVRLYPRFLPVYYLERHPDAAEGDDELFVDLEFNVIEDGRAQDVLVIDRNVPNDKVRLLRQMVRGIRYRPRIQDGVIVATEGLRLHQTYRVPGE